MPIVSYLFNIFAISILVPTPSVHATILGWFIPSGMSVIDPNPPIFENFFLPFFFDETLEMNLIKLSAAFILTPLFFIGKFFFIH